MNKILDAIKKRFNFKETYTKRSIQVTVSLSFTAISIVSMAIMAIAFYTHFVTTTREMAIEQNEQVLNQVSWWIRMDVK